MELVGDALVSALDIEITMGNHRFDYTQASIYVHDSMGSHPCLPESCRAPCTYDDDMGYGGHLRVLEGDWIAPSLELAKVNGMSHVLQIAPQGKCSSVKSGWVLTSFLEKCCGNLSRMTYVGLWLGTPSHHSLPCHHITVGYFPQLTDDQRLRLQKELQKAVGKYWRDGALPRKEMCGWSYSFKHVQAKRYPAASLFAARVAYRDAIEAFNVAFADCHLLCGKRDDPPVIGVVRDGCDGEDLTLSLRDFVHEWFIARDIRMDPRDVCLPTIHINMGKLSEVSVVFLNDASA